MAAIMSFLTLDHMCELFSSRSDLREHEERWEHQTLSTNQRWDIFVYLSCLLVKSHKISIVVDVHCWHDMAFSLSHKIKINMISIVMI